MAKSAQPSPVLKTWNRLSFVNKVYTVLFLFLLVAMAVSIPFVAGDKQLGELRSKASENCKLVPKYGQGCKDSGDWKGQKCSGTAPCCDKNMYLGNEEVCDAGGQGGGGETDDTTDGASAPPPGSGVCDASGNCTPPPGAGGGGSSGGDSGSSRASDQRTKPSRETMQAICPFIMDFIEEEGLPETSEDTKALKQYLKSHNTEYKGWGRIDQFSGSEIYRFAKKYCPDFPTPTPTPTP